MSNESKHSTPPWKFAPETASAHAAIESDSGLVCAFKSEAEPEGLDLSLMLAAPDLLKALNLLLENWPPHRDGMDDPIPVGVKRARAAIAKATGGTP